MSKHIWISAAMISGTLAFLVYRFAKARKKVFHFRDKHNKDIHLVNSAEEWDAVYPLLSEHCQTVKVVGFDCEWVFWGMRLPVALIQIATQDGLCLLVRIFQFSDNIPQTLKDFLSDKSILKVGISAKDDGNKLFTDYGMIVNGCVDLRFLLGRVRGFTCKSLGLQGLAEGVLRVNMVKDRNIRCGDWEAECLSNEQIDYAADDALIAVDIFMHLVSVKIHGREQRKLFYGCSAEIDPTSFWKVARSFCQGIVDMPFKNQKTNLLPLNGKVLSDDDYEGTGEDDDDDNDNTESYEQPGTSSKGRQPVLKPGRLKDGKKAFMARKRPLYYNCRILAPDGSCLTTCDIRKAEWYIAKELADKVNTEEGAPLTIKLRFQPSGKPGSDRDYYLQDKDNVCVVCGKEEDYVRKLVVPKEYRKYFPSLMKDHSSHDVLLLCITCHLQSAVYEGLLRQQLAMECGAPLDSGKDSKRMQDQDLAKVVSASKALLTSKNKIPEQRLIELENIVKNYYGVEHLTEDLLHRAVEIDFTVHNSKFVPHGKKVVDFYMNKDGGLLEFEKMWRRNFVETMKPQFLPKMWSIEHRPEKMTTNTEYNASDFLKDTVDQ